MGYLDALVAGSFKTTASGQRLFFPWGILGRGYVIPSEREFEQLRRYLKVYQLLSLALIIAAILWTGFRGAAAAVILVCVVHVAWAHVQSRRLSRANERLSLGESLAAQSRAQSTVILWLLELGSLAFVGGGVFIVLADHKKWLLAAATIVFFGACAASYAWMLVVKRRGTRSPT
jgi:hypothetical protein